MKNEKLTFTCGEGGEAEEFFVVEQTRLNGVTYLLVADSEVRRKRRTAFMRW